MLTRPNAIFGGVVILFLLTISLVWRGSPYLYANAFQTAVETSDLPTIVKLVEVETVRQELSEATLESLPPSVRLAGNVILSAQVRDLLARSFKKVFVDRATMPQRIASLLRGNGILPTEILARIPPEMLTERTMQIERGYGDTSDVFLVRFVAKETGEEATAVMRRTGWFSWRVVAIRLSPPYSLLWPLRFRREE